MLLWKGETSSKVPTDFLRVFGGQQTLGAAENTGLAPQALSSPRIGPSGYGADGVCIVPIGPWQGGPVPWQPVGRSSSKP